MKFVGLFSFIFLLFITIFIFSSEVDAGRAKKIKIAKKVAKLLLLRGAAKSKIILALPLPLPVPIPIIRKTVHAPISNSGWYSGNVNTSPHTTYEIPSLTSLPESIFNLLKPALNTIAATSMRNANAWSSVNAYPAVDSSWSSYPVAPIESAWPSSSPMNNQVKTYNAWPASNVEQQQQEIVEQQQTSNFA